MRKMIPLYESLINDRKNFEVECSNSYYNIKFNGSSFKFFHGQKMNFEVFNLARKLKNDILGNDIIGVKNDSIEEYFRSNQDFDFNLNEKFYCIDIKKAYATILKNRKLISKERYNEICNLKKPDRLKVVGMLARKKTRYFYMGGKMHIAEIKRQETEKYFFYCVEQTYLLMSDISKKIGSDFIFFWVDCIFFVGEKNIKYIEDRLKSERFEFTFERMRLKGISESKSFSTYDFLKSGKRKIYNVPKVNKLHILGKAKNCLINEDFKGFKNYMDEFRKFS